MPQADSPSKDSPDAPPSAARRGAFVLILVLLPLVVLALAEGSASLVLFAAGVLHPRSSDARGHTTYDSLLGWSSIPGLSDPDYYGRGIGLRIGRAGFREPSAANAHSAGKRRVVCLGDSFTFGHGVADSAAWCARLAQGNPGLETTNMGQVGFGLDQDLLWFRRDGRALEPDILVMAFIKADLSRIQSREFIGVPKPWLTVDHDSILVHGVPVHRLGPLGRLWLRVQPQIPALRLSQLAVRLRGDRSDSAPAADAGASRLAPRILASLARWQHAHGHEFIAVLIPVEGDYAGHGVDRLRTMLQAAADSGHFQFVDLVTELRKLPPDSIAPLYIQAGTNPPRHAEGHLTVHGNEWLVRQLLPRLAPAPPS